MTLHIFMENIPNVDIMSCCSSSTCVASSHSNYQDVRFVEIMLTCWDIIDLLLPLVGAKWLDLSADQGSLLCRPPYVEIDHQVHVEAVPPPMQDVFAYIARISLSCYFQVIESINTSIYKDTSLFLCILKKHRNV